VAATEYLYSLRTTVLAQRVKPARRSSAAAVDAGRRRSSKAANKNAASTIYSYETTCEDETMHLVDEIEYANSSNVRTRVNHADHNTTSTVETASMPYKFEQRDVAPTIDFAQHNLMPRFTISALLLKVPYLRLHLHAALC
jgi:hypothetical protein